MRALAGFLAICALAAYSAFADPSDAQPIQLKGYYELNKVPIWRESDAAPWYVLRKAPWADESLVRYGGYVPVLHDGKQYYCLTDAFPLSGTHIAREPIFICGDHTMAKFLYDTNSKPTVKVYGQH